MSPVTSNDDVEYTLLHSTTGQYFTSFKQAKTYNIPKVQEGKYVKLSKKELDELFAPPTIER